MGLRDEIRDLKRQLGGPEPDPALVAHKVVVYLRCGLAASEEDAFRRAYEYGMEVRMGVTPADRIRAVAEAERFEALYGVLQNDPSPDQGSGTSNASLASDEWYAAFEKALRAERARLEEHDRLRELLREPS